MSESYPPTARSEASLTEVERYKNLDELKKAVNHSGEKDYKPTQAVNKLIEEVYRQTRVSRYIKIGKNATPGAAGLLLLGGLVYVAGVPVGSVRESTEVHFSTDEFGPGMTAPRLIEETDEWRVYEISQIIPAPIALEHLDEETLQGILDSIERAGLNLETGTVDVTTTLQPIIGDLLESVAEKAGWNISEEWLSAVGLDAQKEMRTGVGRVTDVSVQGLASDETAEGLPSLGRKDAINENLAEGRLETGVEIAERMFPEGTSVEVVRAGAHEVILTIEDIEAIETLAEQANTEPDDFISNYNRMTPEEFSAAYNNDSYTVMHEALGAHRGAVFTFNIQVPNSEANISFRSNMWAGGALLALVALGSLISSEITRRRNRKPKQDDADTAPIRYRRNEDIDSGPPRSRRYGIPLRDAQAPLSKKEVDEARQLNREFDKLRSKLRSLPMTTEIMIDGKKITIADLWEVYDEMMQVHPKYNPLGI